MPDTGQKEVEEFSSRIKKLEKAWSEVQQSDFVRRKAERLLAVHPLRAADALQLAAAIVGFDHHVEGAELVTFDDQLTRAARKEGFVVLP